MTTTKQRMTLEEYLAYDDGSDVRHELVAGELVVMPPETPNNSTIALFLLLQFAQFVPLRQLSHKDIEIVVAGSRATTRFPDLMVLTEELADILGQSSRGTITLDMPPPALVVEVVSPGKSNQERDYRYKRSEYGARCIEEYWIVDPQQAQITVLTWVNGLYEEAVFRGNLAIASPTFPALNLSPKQVFDSVLG